MSDLTVEKIIEIHDEIILRYEGAQGVLSEATLHFMVFRANRTEDTFTRAAIILHAIRDNQPFTTYLTIQDNYRTMCVLPENTAEKF